MKSIIRILAIALSLLVGSGLCSASAAPEGFEGVITSISAKQVTVKNQDGAKVFKIDKAGVCGWPTRKKIPDVFKMGDNVIVYCFSSPTSKSPTPALNVFFADEEKVRAFQKGEPMDSSSKQLR